MNELSPMAGAGRRALALRPQEWGGGRGALIRLRRVGDGNVLPRKRNLAAAKY